MYKFLLALLLSTNIGYAKERDYIYDVEVVSVYDGDTITVNIDLGFSIWIQEKSLRLYGINAPEVKGSSKEEGLKVRDWLRNKISQGKKIIIESIKDEPDKYGRYLAIIYIDGVNINQLMLDEGLVVAYNP